MTRLEEIVNTLYQNGHVTFTEAAALLMAVTAYFPNDKASVYFGTLATEKLEELRTEYVEHHGDYLSY